MKKKKTSLFLLSTIIPFVFQQKKKGGKVEKCSHTITHDKIKKKLHKIS